MESEERRVQSRSGARSVRMFPNRRVANKTNSNFTNTLTANQVEMSNQIRLAGVLACNCGARLMKSPVILVLFIIQVRATILATQAQRYPPSEAGGLSPIFPILKSNEPVKLRLLQADPIVFNANSLYVHNSDRHKRSASTNLSALSNQQQKFVDACQSKMEVLTPYYASNSKGKLRTIVNSELMQQAIQVETCVR